VALVREDAPWAWGYWPYVGLAFQSWTHNGKPSIMIRDLAKYYRIDAKERVARQAQWNRPTWWPMLLLIAAALALAAVGRRSYRLRQQATATRVTPAPVAAT
jgi:hypothetical protein